MAFLPRPRLARGPRGARVRSMAWHRVSWGRLVALAALAVAVPLDVACSKKPEISFSLLVPASVREAVAWYEVGAFANAPCPPLGELGGGVPVGANARVIFHASQGKNPGLGSLETGSYAFIAVAKGENCEVLASGCSSVEVSESSNVSVPMYERKPPTGACTAGNVCQQGQCVPPINDDGTGSSDECTLEVVGGGPLFDPPGSTTALVSAPSVVATDQGFLIAYRTNDGKGATFVTFMSIDKEGGLGTVAPFAMSRSCSGGTEKDGLGLALSNGKAWALAGRPPTFAGDACNDKAGFHSLFIPDLSHIDAADRNSIKYALDVGGARPVLSPAHAVAPAPNGGFFAAYLVNGTAYAVRSKMGEQPVPDETTVGPFGGPEGTATHAWVAGTDDLVALLALGTGVPPPPPVFDAGPEASVPEAGAFDAGAISNEPVGELRLTLGTAAVQKIADLDPTPYRIQAQPAGSDPDKSPSWGALAAQGKRLVVANSSPGGGEEFRVFELGTREPVLSAVPISTDDRPISDKPVAWADIALDRDHLYFALQHAAPSTERVTGITVVGFRGLVNLHPKALGAVSLGANSRVPRSVKDVRIEDGNGGRVAIAASQSRVAVVWTAAPQLTANDAVGGYAILACR
jgi:hypothetical protein